MAKKTSRKKTMADWYMPNGEKIAHGDGKEDNEGRRKIRHKTPTSKVAEGDEGEVKVSDHNDDIKGNNDNMRSGKLRDKDA